MPLGLEDRRIHDGMFRASSHYNSDCEPRNARLNQRRTGRFGGAWCPKKSSFKEWLQIDFGALTRFTRVQTQGRHNSDQWVTSYTLSHSKNGWDFVSYKEGRVVRVRIYVLFSLFQVFLWLYGLYSNMILQTPAPWILLLFKG